jgi:hypothetical protein
VPVHEEGEQNRKVIDPVALFHALPPEQMKEVEP